MTSKHSILSDRRQKSLDALKAAVKRDRGGIRTARRTAIQDTVRLLRIELQIQNEAKAREKREERTRTSQDNAPDLFQMVH